MPSGSRISSLKSGNCALSSCRAKTSACWAIAHGKTFLVQAERTHKLLGPSRDLFAAIFFLFFGLQIDPASLPPVLLLAVSLGIFTTLTKILTGWWAARRAKTNPLEAFRAGAALVARGEFSIVIAGLGVSAGLEPQLGALSAAYVLFLAILGPILARFIEPIYLAFHKDQTTSS